VWAEAAKWLNKFPEAVLTATDEDGYPFSVRVPTNGYDGSTGEVTIAVPDNVHPVNGPASLLCHSHDEKMWNLQMITVKGTLEKRGTTWTFITESFTPPSKLMMLDFVRNARNSARRYLDKRGLSRPEVNWASIKDVQRRAKG
jgi:hypothetical protein